MGTTIKKIDMPSGAKESFDDVSAIKGTLTPEIVIALCGPMGTPLHAVAENFKELLLGSDYHYETVNIIKLSDEIRNVSELQNEKSISKLIEAGNTLREKYGNEVLAKLAIRKISLEREKTSGNKMPEDSAPEATVRHCHIIDSVKHKDELKLLRSVYGEMLYVVGVYAPIELRIAQLEKNKQGNENIYELIDRDSGEENDHGQRVSDTFPLADFFLRIEQQTDTHRKKRVKRFLDLILGTSIITPTLNERSMYAAFSAARNSACLSRQVGAAISDEKGDVLATGWNDVPKAFGGLYQNDSLIGASDQDHRCWNINGGKCFNDEEKDLISTAIIDLLIKEAVLKEADREKTFEIIRKGSQLKNLIEFSRAVHAEMHALLNAGAVHGSKISGGKLFVTTYPCHSCARHIVAAGIKEVYFLEPYRKSLATKLHEDAITENENDNSKVRIMPFDGVAPSRFLHFFSSHPQGRKQDDGRLKRAEAYPVTSVTMEAIPTLESLVVRGLESQKI